MSNPTREDLERYKAIFYQRASDWDKRLCDAYLRALDMRNEIAQSLDSEIGAWYKPKEIRKAIQKFDGGGDDG